MPPTIIPREFKRKYKRKRNGSNLYQERVPGAPSASFTPILAGNYTQNFIEAMHQAGVSFKENIIGDGTIHRFSTGNNTCL